MLPSNAAFPSPLFPKVTSAPAATYTVCIFFASISVMKFSGRMAAVSLFSGNSTSTSIPIFSKAARFSSRVISSLSCAAPKSTAGGGSKVNTAAFRPCSFCPNMHRSNFWCPRWIPSNLPMAAAVSPSSSNSVVPCIICI